VKVLRALVFLLFAGAAASPAFAQHPDHDAVNDANNPLTPKITINLQDYYIPEFFGAPGHANQFLFRGLIPWKLGDSGQLFRFTVPLASAPDFGGGYDTGLGDTTLMNLTPVPISKSLMLAAGPILVAPTASDRVLGSGRWQAGAAGVVIMPQTWGMLGTLLTYQHSFAEPHGRAPVSIFTFQPIVNINLRSAFTFARAASGVSISRTTSPTSPLASALAACSCWKAASPPTPSSSRNGPSGTTATARRNGRSLPASISSSPCTEARQPCVIVL
jgi:hypothetical protein